ncbi:sensor histidine kinase [Clostridium sp. SHJSY1]|uniref:sensor histidine kinase n=1 Tax=Clostridium sp. SHJSY1 TaxID=2942483 RepID=UPI0028760748|nr:sensor histidine kinase [Clostridium sp. SHJSY1]MDS0527818.1 sensor histidine kinase [Clostridium sp. SHJSY1]
MKNKIKTIVNNINIRNKLILTYLIVAIATVSVVGIYSSMKMTQIVINRAINEAKTNADTMQHRLEEVLRLATRVSDMIYSDDELNSIISKNYSDNAEVVEKYSNYSTLKNYLKYYKEISGITLYVENQTLLGSENILKVTEDIKNKDWYKKAVNDRGKISWSYLEDDLSSSYHLSLTRAIMDNRGKKIGVLVINISPYELTDIISMNSENNIIMLDSETISLDKNYSIDKDAFNLVEEKELINGDNSILNGNFNNKNSYIVWNSFSIEKSLNNKFGVFTSLPLSEITQQTRTVIINIVGAVALAIILSLAIILYFSKNIASRINLLRFEMHRVVKGDFNIGKRIYGNDEIGQLYEDLNIMINSIKRLINEVYKGKIQKEKLKAYQKEVEFKMLSSQINPHFLYNTLETIRMKAFCNGDKEIANIVKKLGKIMRRNLEVSGKVVTLESELKLIGDYLEIQSMRFEGMVEYNLDVQEELDIENYKILPLLLQPVVENAFVHGLEEKAGKGEILVKIFKKNKYLIIEVKDNGEGIEKEKLLELKKGLSITEEGKRSIGMKNVNQRIKIHYGQEYGLGIESELHKGTKVTLCLPV